MLSDEEKREMLQDAKSKMRRNDFRFAKRDTAQFTFDDYLLFLNNVQEIFSPFEIPYRKTSTKINRL